MINLSKMIILKLKTIETINFLIYQIEKVNHVRPTSFHVRPTRYGSCIIGLSPFDNVIFIVKLVIFFVSRLIYDITPTLAWLVGAKLPFYDTQRRFLNSLLGFSLLVSNIGYTFKRIKQ